MTALLLTVIVSLIGGALVYVDDMLLNIVPIALNAETNMDNLLGASIVSGLFDYFYGVGMSLLVLKFLYKGFNTYILWSDGDPDSEPITLLTGFVSAMFIATSFPTLYGWLAEIINKATNDIKIGRAHV